MTDAELIRAYADRQSESAFAELVNRHLGLVYASALRQVQTPDVAADVTQTVFLLLARKAPSLRREVILSGWLFRTTRFVAIRARRTEQRRQHHEQEAAIMNLQHQSSPQAGDPFREISPHLDDAVAALSEADRRAVLLRFFERKPLREVGGQLGLSEDAAKKRVSRAVDKLRAFLGKRGVTLSSVSLATLLLEFRGEAAPAGLAPMICAASAGSAAATSATIAGLLAGGLRDLMWWKARSLLPWATGITALLVATVFWFPVPKPGTQSAGTEVPDAGLSVATATVAGSPAPRSSVAAAVATGPHLVLSILDRHTDQPIAGARVRADVWGLSGFDQSSERTTEADGTCVLPVPSPPFSTLNVWLSAPGYVPVVLNWQSHELGQSDVFHTSRLTRGTMLRAEVRDEAGQPVVNARIQFGGPGTDSTKRENVAFNSHLYTCKTDETGRFQFDQMPSEGDWTGGISLGITHPDFALGTFGIQGAPDLATNHQFTLIRGVALRGQVIGPQGEPVSDASLQQVEKWFGLETRTDSDGRFEFPHVKPGSYTLAVTAEGYAQLKSSLLVETNGTDMTFQLTAQEPGAPLKPNPLRLIGRVVDAENDEPVTRFRVLFNERRGVSDRLLGEGINGKFDWTTQSRYVREFSLVVEADGYEPQESDVRKINDPEQRFEFRLKRGSDLTGVVLQPDGEPAANASLGLAAEGKFTLNLQAGGTLANYGNPVNRTTTDERGRFSLRTMVGAEQLLVAHTTGCFVLPIASATNIAIKLQAWGAIEGVLLVGTNPASNQQIIVGFGPVPGQSGLIPFQYNATTDAEGKFRFTRVQPGMHRVQRLHKFYQGETGPIGFSHGEIVTVRAGETTRVVLGGKGIAVVGKIELSPGLANYDWTQDPQMLIEQRPDLPEVRPPDARGDVQAYMRAWSARDSQIAKYYLVIGPDGRFQTDDVLPGTYTLQVRINAAPEVPLDQDAWVHPRRELGRTDLTVTIPDTDFRVPMDLGVIKIPVTNSVPVKTTGAKGGD